MEKDNLIVQEYEKALKNLKDRALGLIDNAIDKTIQFDDKVEPFTIAFEGDESYYGNGYDNPQLQYGHVLSVTKNDNGYEAFVEFETDDNYEDEKTDEDFDESHTFVDFDCVFNKPLLYLAIINQVNCRVLNK
jgi:hypothetical protein